MVAVRFEGLGSQQTDQKAKTYPGGGADAESIASAFISAVGAGASCIARPEASFTPSA